MFSVGELVVYGGEGVCRVEKIGPSNISCADRDRDYYTLAPLYHTGQVITPVDTRVLMRPIMTQQEAESFIDTLPQLTEEPLSALSQRAAREHYQALVTSYDCCRLASFLKALFRKRTAAIQSGKKVSQLDERYGKRAEEHLYGELAAALGIERSAVCSYISDRCGNWLEHTASI